MITYIDYSVHLLKVGCGAWMMSKSLLTRQEITDGGFYSALAVAFIRGDKTPGFHILANSDKWIEVRGERERTIEPLGGNWIEGLSSKVRGNAPYLLIKSKKDFKMT